LVEVSGVLASAINDWSKGWHSNKSNVSFTVTILTGLAEMK